MYGQDIHFYDHRTLRDRRCLLLSKFLFCDLSLRHLVCLRVTVESHDDDDDDDDVRRESTEIYSNRVLMNSISSSIHGATTWLLALDDASSQYIVSHAEHCHCA